MKRGITIAAAAAMLVSSSAGASVNVSARGSNVSIDAKMAPLGDVLQQLSRVTGMKLDVSGAMPRTPLNLTLVDEPMAAVVGRVLEGAGLDFALTLDPSRQKVVSLIILGKSTTTAAGARPNVPRPIVRQPFEEPTEEDAAEEEEDMGPQPEGPVFQQPQPPPPGSQGEGQPAAPTPPFGAPPGQQQPTPAPTPEAPGPTSVPKFPTYDPFSGSPSPTPAATPAPTPPPDQQSVVPRPGRPTPKPPSQ